MSSNDYAKPDLSETVRYSRKEQEDGAEWEQREVDIYESTDDIRDSHAELQTQGGGPQTQNLPPVKKELFRYAALGLTVLCLLMLAGIIILSTCLTLKITFLETKNNNINQLQAKITEVNGNMSQLREEVKKLNDEIKNSLTQLQSCYRILSKNHSQLQEEVKKLNIEIKSNLTQLQSSYRILSKNHSQLQE